MVYDPNWDYKKDRPANSRPGVPKHLPVNPSKNGGWDNPDAARKWISSGILPPPGTKLPPGVVVTRSAQRAAARAARRARGG